MESWFAGNLMEFTGFLVGKALWGIFAFKLFFEAD